MIVDAHMHIWRKLHGKIGNKAPLVGLGNGMIRIGKSVMLGMPASHVDCSARAEWVIAEFDAAGVDVGVVVQEYMDGEQNDYVLEMQRKYPGRFFMHGLPDFFKPRTIARQAAKLFARGFKGLKLPGSHLAAAGVPLDLPAFMPVYEQMADEGHVLAVDLSTGEAQVPMMENILRRFPRLRVAVGHFGMPNRDGWPGQLRLCRHENVYIETGGIIWLYRREGYPFDGAIKAVLRAKKEVGIEKLMWGSDWPRTMVDFTYRQSIQFVRDDKRLSESDKKSLLGDNASNLYRLKKPSKSRPPVALVTEG